MGLAELAKLVTVVGVFGWGVACAPILEAWPPPATHATALDPVPSGEVEAGANLSGIYGTDWGSANLNFIGGPYAGRVGIGLGERFDLSLSGSKHIMGPTGGLYLGYTALSVPGRYDLGLQVGTAGSWVRDSWKHQETVLDAQGEPKLDEDGEPVVESTWVDFQYLSVAPGVALRGRRYLSPRVWLPLRLRASFSQTVLIDGWVNQPMPQEIWVEVSTGLVWESQGWELGVGLTSLTPMGLSRPLETWVMADLSVGFRLGSTVNRRHPRQRDRWRVRPCPERCDCDCEPCEED